MLFLDRPVNLFIFGGTGFFGKALFEHWISSRQKINKIFVFSRDPEKHSSDFDNLKGVYDVEFVKGDVLEASKVKISCNIDIVLHAATDSTNGPDLERIQLYKQITKGTEEVLEFAVKHGCKKFILASSGGVYGESEKTRKISENCNEMQDPLDTKSAYGVGKRAAEHLCALYSSKYSFDYVIGRFFTFVGKDIPLDKHFAVGNFLKNVINNEDIEIMGSGLVVRSYMYQGDLAQALTNLMFQRTQCRVYNIGSDQAVSIGELANTLKKISNSKGQVRILNSLKDEKFNYYVPNIDRYQREFCKHRIKNLEESLRLTLEALMENRLL